MAQNASAPAIDRMHPETLIRSLPILILRSVALLSNGTRGWWCTGGSRRRGPQEPPPKGAALAHQRSRPGSGFPWLITVQQR